MGRRVLVTGSRQWTDWSRVVEQLFRMRPGDVLVHGACPKGADRIADRIGNELPGITVERHPADWSRHGRSAGPIRNNLMVSLGADVCFAFPLPGGSGTQHCISSARKAGIPTHVITS